MSSLHVWIKVIIFTTWLKIRGLWKIPVPTIEVAFLNILLCLNNSLKLRDIYFTITIATITNNSLSHDSPVNHDVNSYSPHVNLTQFIGPSRPGLVSRLIGSGCRDCT